MNRQRRGRSGGGREQGSRGPAMPPPGQPGRECHRDAVAPGTNVFVVKKEDQRSGRETAGTVSRLLTNSAYHPRGIKVMLADGIVGRVTRFDGDSVNEVSRGYVDGGASSSDDDDAFGYNASRTFADFLPDTLGTNNHRGSLMASLQPQSNNVDDDALATLVGDMNFDADKSREALQMFDNDVQRAVDFLIRQEGS